MPFGLAAYAFTRSARNADRADGRRRGQATCRSTRWKPRWRSSAVRWGQGKRFWPRRWRGRIVALHHRQDYLAPSDVTALRQADIGQRTRQSHVSIPERRKGLCARAWHEGDLEPRPCMPFRMIHRATDEDGFPPQLVWRTGPGRPRHRRAVHRRQAGRVLPRCRSRSASACSSSQWMPARARRHHHVVLGPEHGCGDRPGAPRARSAPTISWCTRRSCISSRPMTRPC